MDTDDENQRQEQDERAARIAALNDGLRMNVSNPQGTDCVFMTPGLAALIEDSTSQPFWIDMQALRRIIRTYDDFGTANDPWAERDFGGFTFKGTACFWKVDYYAHDMEHGSPDPADPAVTSRVLTIATMAEY